MSAELTPDNPETVTLDSFEPVRLELVFNQRKTIYAVLVQVADVLGEITGVAYTGDEAKAIIRNLNTADLSAKSLRARILTKLQNDGHLPAGTIDDDGADLQ